LSTRKKRRFGVFGFEIEDFERNCVEDSDIDEINNAAYFQFTGNLHLYEFKHIYLSLLL